MVGHDTEHTRTAWLATCEQDVPADDRWQSSWERERADRMRFTKRRTEFLTSRHTAKRAMALALAEPTDDPARFEVRHHATGAPWPHLDGRPAPLSISMTDRADWAVTLVSDDEHRRLGVDLEIVEPRTGAFVRDWFTPAEQAFVEGVDDEDRRSMLANLVWSAKESALKVLQTGLRRDTRTVEVVLRDEHHSGEGWSPLVVTAVEGAQMPGWWCRLGEFVLTVAADTPIAAPTPLDRATGRIADAVPKHTWLDAPHRGPTSAGPR